jgi:predicted transcriptional regulator
MARKKTPTLTEAELRVMHVVWELGQATVNDVVAASAETRDLAYNTILTTMRILERKGYLTHTKDGRAHVYRPLVDRKQAQTKAVRHMLKSLFDNSPEMLLVNLLRNESLSGDELDRLKSMIEASERDKGKG